MVDHPKVETQTLDRKRSVPLRRLLEEVAQGADDEETLMTLAARLARLARHAVDIEADLVLANRHDRAPTWSEATPEGRWRAFTYDELLARDKVNLDIFWLRDESLEESANLPAPDLLAAEIVEELQAAHEQFAAIAEDLEVAPLD